jgi:hypothetical protein
VGGGGWCEKIETKRITKQPKANGNAPENLKLSELLGKTILYRKLYFFE